MKEEPLCGHMRVAAERADATAVFEDRFRISSSLSQKGRRIHSRKRERLFQADQEHQSYFRNRAGFCLRIHQRRRINAPPAITSMMQTIPAMVHAEMPAGAFGTEGISVVAAVTGAVVAACRTAGVSFSATDPVVSVGTVGVVPEADDDVTSGVRVADGSGDSTTTAKYEKPGVVAW